MRRLLSLQRMMPLLLLAGAARASSTSRVPLENRYDFLTAEVEAHDYMKNGLCPKGTNLAACKSCYERRVCSSAMVGFDTRVGRTDTTVPYPPTTSTVSLTAGFIGAPTFIVSFVWSGNLILKPQRTFVIPHLTSQQERT